MKKSTAGRAPSGKFRISMVISYLHFLTTRLRNWDIFIINIVLEWRWILCNIWWSLIHIRIFLMLTKILCYLSPLLGNNYRLWWNPFLLIKSLGLMADPLNCFYTSKVLWELIYWRLQNNLERLVISLVILISLSLHWFPRFHVHQTLLVRPISLCNSLWKIISKNISNRLKPTPSNGIAQEQFLFLHQIKIQDAVAIARDCTYYQI